MKHLYTHHLLLKDHNYYFLLINGNSESIVINYCNFRKEKATRKGRFNVYNVEI